jgi:hypothetical protein
MVNDFMDAYPSVLNNSRKTNIKQFFLESVQLLEENNLIESKDKIIHKGQFYYVDKLTIYNISEGFGIYENLII